MNNVFPESVGIRVFPSWIIYSILDIILSILKHPLKNNIVQEEKMGFTGTKEEHYTDLENGLRMHYYVRCYWMQAEKTEIFNRLGVDF